MHQVPQSRILVLTDSHGPDALSSDVRMIGGGYQWVTLSDTPVSGLPGWVPEVLVVLIDLATLRERCRDWYDALPGLIQQWGCALVITSAGTGSVPGEELLVNMACEVMTQPLAAATVQSCIRHACERKHLQLESQAAQAQLRTMVHALRTPVQGMMLYLESMLDAAEQAHLEEMVNDVRACQAIAQQMSTLIQQGSRSGITEGV